MLVFQVLPQFEPERCRETNRSLKQPQHVPNLFVWRLKVAYSGRTWKIYKLYFIIHSYSNLTLIWHCLIEKHHTGHNLRVQNGDPTAHAEVVAIRSCGQVWSLYRWFSWLRDNVDNFDRLEICQHFYTTGFLCQKFYTQKMRISRLILPNNKRA